MLASAWACELVGVPGVRLSDLSNLCMLPAWIRLPIFTTAGTIPRIFRLMDTSSRDRLHRAGDGPRPVRAGSGLARCVSEGGGSSWLLDGSSSRRPRRRRGLLRQFCSSVSYGPLGGFLPPLATKLTQSPWFLNVVPKFFQPPFMHWALLVGSGDEKLAVNPRSSM
jgi:hypothetical protein